MSRQRPGFAVSTWFRDRQSLQRRVPVFEQLGGRTLKRLVLTLGTALLGFAAGAAATSSNSDFAPYVTQVLVLTTLVTASLVVRWWVLPLPSRFESLTVLLFSDAVIAVACLGHHDHMLGVAGVTIFSIMSVFAMFFCTSRAHVLHGVFASAVTVLLIVLVAIDRGQDMLLVALSKGIAPFALVLVILPTVHYFLWVLGTNASDAGTDALTRMANRRGLERYLAGLDDSRTVMSVIIIDIDGFKAINDTHGHHIGDLVLVRVGGRITQAGHRLAGIRNLVAARTGGEEFAVILDDELRTARSLAERIRVGVAADTSPSVTVSIGISAASGGGTKDVDRLFEAADAAMYAAKRQGGNRVVVADLGDDRPLARHAHRTQARLSKLG